MGDTLVMRGFTPEEQQRCLFTDEYDPSCDTVFASPGGRARDAAGCRRGSYRLRPAEPPERNLVVVPDAGVLRAIRSRAGSARTHACARLHDPSRVDEFSAAVRSRVAGGHRSQLRGPERESGGRLGSGAHRGARPVRHRCQPGGRRRGRSGGRPAGRNASSGERRLLRALGLSSLQQSTGALLAVMPAVATGVLFGVAGAWLASTWMPIGLGRRVEPSPGRQLDVDRARRRRARRVRRGRGRGGPHGLARRSAGAHASHAESRLDSEHARRPRCRSKCRLASHARLRQRRGLESHGDRGDRVGNSRRRSRW